MKRRIGSLVILVWLAAASGCAHPGWHGRSVNGTTVISVVGSNGTPISGSYVQDGYRLPITGTLPFTLTHDGLSEFEILKVHPDETLALAAQNDDQGWHSEVVSEAGEGVAGLRVLVRNGLLWRS